MAVPLFVLGNQQGKIYKRRTLLENLSDFEVRKHCGLPWTAARDIFDWLEPEFESPTSRNNAIYSETKLLTALSFFRSGSFQWMMGSVSGTSQPSSSRIIELAANVLIGKAKEMVKFPDELEKINEIKTGFYQIGKIPNIIGCVDGSHIEMLAPSEDEQVFVNRYQSHSINCQLVAGPDCYLHDIVAKWPGSTHDSFMWAESSMRKRLQQGVYGDGCLLGDTGYPSEHWLQVPFQLNLNPAKVAYNIAHRKTRSSIERAIGMWKSRFRCIHITGGTLCYKPSKVCKILIATAVLHNFCIAQKIALEDEDQDFLENILLPSIQANETY